VVVSSADALADPAPRATLAAAGAKSVAGCAAAGSVTAPASGPPG
jgi:hypothetical protein